MRVIQYIISVLLLVLKICRADSEAPMYIYPVDAYEHDGKPHMLVLKQWSIDKLELYDWNVIKGTMTKAIMGMYTPAAVAMLPDQSGFSFVDNGRIRIKRFEKRSVKTLDIYEPIYGIELARWLDNQTCYFHAQSDGHYGIYTLTLDEELTPVLVNSSVDYMYPYIVGNALFYIERNPKGNNKRKYGYSIGARLITGDRQAGATLVKFSTKPLMLLQMISQDEGFVIECGAQNELYTFHYHHLAKSDTGWQSRELFHFQVTRELFIDGPQRLYESMLPLVPHVQDGYVYFSSWDQHTGLLALYRFSLQTGLIELIAGSSGHLFVPLFWGRQGIAGGNTYPFEHISLN